MPAFGSHTPLPLRFGGGTSRVTVILNSLLAQRGSAYTDDVGSAVYIECLAIARAIAATWGTNKRLSHVWDPSKLVGNMLDRWENILAIVPRYSASDAERRAAVRERFVRAGVESVSGLITETIVEAVGNVFVRLEYVPLAEAHVHVPDGTYPWGTVQAGAPWFSTLACVLALLRRPAGMSDGELFEAGATVNRILDSTLPSDALGYWYSAPEESALIAIPNGASEAGFYLDEANLDQCVFDT